MRSISATDVPPNFITRRAMAIVYCASPAGAPTLQLLRAGAKGAYRYRCDAPPATSRCSGGAILELHRNAQLGFEVIDRVVFDDRHAYFDMGAHPIGKVAADRKVKRQEKLAGLAGDRGSGVYPDIVARIQNEIPVLRQADIEGRGDLRLIDCRFRRIAGKAESAQRSTGTKYVSGPISR